MSAYASISLKNNSNGKLTIKCTLKVADCLYHRHWKRLRRRRQSYILAAAASHIQSLNRLQVTSHVIFYSSLSYFIWRLTPVINMHSARAFRIYNMWIYKAHNVSKQAESEANFFFTFRIPQFRILLGPCKYNNYGNIVSHMVYTHFVTNPLRSLPTSVLMQLKRPLGS